MKRVLLGAAGLVAAFVGLVGFAHTAPGRPLKPLLYAIAGRAPAVARCPLGYDRAAADQPGLVRASRPTLGFTLAGTTRDDVLRWARTQGVTCKAHGEGELECVDAPAALLAGSPVGARLELLRLRFTRSGLLTGVTALRRASTAEPLAFAEMTRAMATGAACSGGGSLPADAPLLAQVSAHCTGDEYDATARATNFGSSWVLTQHYAARVR